MNLHESQGKDILNSFGVNIQRGIVASNSEDAVIAAKKLSNDTGTSWFVIKAQVHAGGRGKAGGVKILKTIGSNNFLFHTFFLLFFLEDTDYQHLAFLLYWSTFAFIILLKIIYLFKKSFS